MSEHKPGSRAATPEEIRQMTPEEAMIAGAEVDGIHIVHRRDRFPIRGTKAEKRAERGVALAFLISALAGVGFIVAFIAVPYKWHLPGTPQNFRSTRRPWAACWPSCCCSSASAWSSGPSG